MAFMRPDRGSAGQTTDHRSMSLVSNGVQGWTLNGIQGGGPYSVHLVGPWKLPQVQDPLGTVAVSGPEGAVFCASLDEAETLCKLANAGEL